MRKNVPNRNRYVLSSHLTGVAVFLFPLTLHHVDFRAAFTRGLSVSAHRASPAYAAFEDLRADYSGDEFSFPQKFVQLAAGQTFDFAKTLESQPSIRQLSLKGVVIRAPAATEPASFFVAGEETHQEIPLPRSLPPPPALIYDSSGNLLPLVERKRQLVEELKAEDWQIPNPRDLARQLVAQELRNSSPAPSSPSHGETHTPPPPSHTPPPRREVADNGFWPRASAGRAEEPKPSVNIASALSTHNPNPADLRPLWLTGQVEMTEGLAFVGPETQITVKRIFNGYTYEVGRIWVTEGRFEIRIKEPVGFLVAELRTQQGRVLGHGEISLLDLGKVAANEDRIAGLRIPLKPTVEGATFRAISGYSHGAQKMPVTTARIEVQSYSDPQKVNEEGYVNEPTLSRDSSFVARAVAKDHWSSLVVGQAREPQDIRLFSNKLVSALIDLNLNGTERKEAHGLAVVWGRLVREGQVLAGAEVELAGDAKPIYFDEMYLPNPKLKATSSNGLFAFIAVPQGIQALRVAVDGKRYPAQVFPTENRYVSYVELEVRDKVVSQFKVFDGLDPKKSVRAQIRLVGNEESLPIGQEDFVSYSVAANPFMVEAEAGPEYQISRVTVTGAPHVVHVPLVRRDWLARVAGEKSMTQMPNRGVIVGLIDDGGFEVEMTGATNAGEALQISYFDAQGRVVEGKTGVAGGGFVIFNAPAGLQTLYVHSAQSRETFSQIVVAEPDFVQVVTH